ncbi:G5 domain-containing protein [Micromonospora sp. NPDC047812]|uniref:G5 domain-containing protein n=1 Tax=Micromonospora sp. NPDC047812 TaxID=3155742 RepID=UPI003451C342
MQSPPKRRSPLKIVLISAVTLALLCCGGAVISAMVSPPPEPQGQKQPAAESIPTVQPSDVASPTVTEQVPTQQAAPTQSPEPSESAAPVVQTRTVTETQRIAYRSRTVRDPSLLKGTRKVTTRGVAGVKTLTYQVIFTDGAQTAKKLIKSEITRAPVTQVVRVGTKQTRQCDPNYSGACVPVASDVDCAGGSGNGPAYVHGPVRVVGSDIYDLDRDGDGVGCDD